MITTRLGRCEVCDSQPAKYTCPGCNIKTCSLACVRTHKEEIECDGVRDKTAYKPLSAFSNLDLLSDYRLMENISHSVDNYQRDPSKECDPYSGGHLPRHLRYLRQAAHKREMRLWYLPRNFQRHKENTTYLDWKSHIIEWHVDWAFLVPGTGQRVKITSGKVVEDVLLGDCLGDVLSQAAGLDALAGVKPEDVEIFLQAENIPQARNRFFAMSKSKSLKDNLHGHTLVEFPFFLVVLKEHASQITVVTLASVAAEREAALQNRKRQHDDCNSAAAADCEEEEEEARDVVPEENTKRHKLHIPSYEKLCKNDEK